MNDCLFCKIINRELPAYIIGENDSVIVINSLENHPLVIPKNHSESIFDIGDIDLMEVIKEASRIAKALKKALNCDGINIVQSNGKAAGQDVFHFHLHVKPRWIGDNVKLQWNNGTVEKEIREQTAESIRTAMNDAPSKTNISNE